MPDVWGELEPLMRRTVGLGACMTGTGYLLADNAVDDFSQALLRQAGKDALQTQCPLPQRFSHAHVQVVVGLLGSQVLGREGRTALTHPRHPAPAPRMSSPTHLSSCPWSTNACDAHPQPPCGTPSSPTFPTDTYHHIKAGVQAHDLTCRGGGWDERKTGKRFRSERGCWASPGVRFWNE